MNSVFIIAIFLRLFFYGRWLVHFPPSLVDNVAVAERTEPAFIEPESQTIIIDSSSYTHAYKKLKPSATLQRKAERMAEKVVDEKKINGGGLVKVDPKPSNGFTSKVIDFLEKLVVKFMYDSSLPHHYLSGNFAPVPDETPPIKDLPVKGYLPVSASGYCPI